MASEESGEWKLLKTWECKKCKVLIKDGRKVFSHVCTVKEEEDKLSALVKIIDARDISIEERDTFIDGQKIKIGTLDKRIEGLEHFIKELNAAIDGYNNTKETRDKIIEEQKIAIEEHKKTIDDQRITIEQLNGIMDGYHNATIEKDKIIEEQKIAVEEHKIAIEDHKKTIDNQKVTIVEQDATIENQKRSQGKVVEKVVYLEKGTSNVRNDNVISDINVDILQRDSRIKDSKDSGYREEIEVEIFERGKGKEKIIIKNGKVIKKPDDIIIIGKNTPEGFIVKGIYRN